MPRLAALCALLLAVEFITVSAARAQPLEHRVFTTSVASELEDALNEAGAEGFRFAGKLELEGGVITSPVGVIVARSDRSARSYHYWVIEAAGSAALEDELQRAGEAGFDYRGQVVFKDLFNPGRVALVLEQVDPVAGEAPARPRSYEYRLITGDSADSLQRELVRVGADGFAFVAGAVGESVFGARSTFGIARRVVGE